MDPSETIVIAIAERECKRLARRVIRHLQSMKERYMQSGDDSPLANVWDEVCVQVQGQESVMWETYVETLEGIVLGFVAELDPEIKQAIWLQTREGTEWEPKDRDHHSIPWSDDEIAQYVLNDYIMKAAANWTNARIEKCKDQDIEFD